MELSFISAVLDIDEDTYSWNATVVLTNLADYSNFKQDDLFEIHIHDDIYSFMVDSKSMARLGPAEVQYTIIGVSPSAQYDAPRFYPLYSKTWDVPVMAKTAVEDALGTTISWDLIDWQLPAYRLVFEDVTALTVAETLVTSAGGTLQTDATTGELYARHLYPVAVPDYSTATIDHSFNEVDDILTMNSDLVAGVIVNKLRLLDFELSYQDVLVFKESEESELEGHLRAFPSPWRISENVSVESTNCDTRITLQPLGVETILIPEVDDEGEPLSEEYELVEITEGEGTLQYPIWILDEIIWDSCVLGSVGFEPGSKTISISNPTIPVYGLIRVKYFTKFYNYYVQSSEHRPAQFIMKDVQL